MDLDKTLHEYQNAQRTSLTVVHFVKHFSWHSLNNIVLTLNRLQEDILLRWISEFIQSVLAGGGISRSGASTKELPCSFDYKGPLNHEILPFQFEVFESSIEVSYIKTDRKGTSRTSLFFVIDGTVESNLKFKKAIIDDNIEKLGMYSPRRNIFVTTVKE